MRKGQKKIKDVLTVKDHAVVRFWEEEESPCFKEGKHSLLESCFTRDPRLKNARIQLRQLLSPDTLETYSSFELFLVDESQPERNPLLPLEVYKQRPDKQVHGGSQPEILGNTENV